VSRLPALALALALAGCPAAGKRTSESPPAAVEARAEPEAMTMIIPATTVGRAHGWAISVGVVLDSTTYLDAEGAERKGPAALIGVFAQDGAAGSEVKSKVGAGSIIEAGPPRFAGVGGGPGEGAEAVLAVSELPAGQ